MPAAAPPSTTSPKVGPAEPTTVMMGLNTFGDVPPTLLTTDDPVRVFERHATLDAVSNGRAEVVMGRGSSVESFPLFGKYGMGDLPHASILRTIELYAERVAPLVRETLARAEVSAREVLRSGSATRSRKEYARALAQPPTGTTPHRGGRMVNVGLLVTLNAKPGKEQELADFLAGALPLAQEEAGTTAWFANRIDASTYGIYDVFPGAQERQAHLDGPIAAALMAKADDLLSSPPDIKPIEVLAAKLPG